VEVCLTTAVECQGLTRRFGEREAVSQLDLSVPKGTVFGFLGPNGAGKTTTVRMMVGMLKPSAGSVRVLGLDPVGQGEEVRARCGVMLDQVGLYERLTAWQNVELAARIARLPVGDRRERIAASLERVGLWDRRSDRVSSFSKGMRQKLGLARALMAGPEMLILDEPTAGLDPENIVMVRELLVSLVAEGGRTVFLCTHLLAEAQRICNQVGIIQGGRLRALGAPEEIGRAGLPTVRLSLSGLDAARTDTLPLPAGSSFRALGHGEWRATVADPADIERIVAALVQAGVGVRAVVPEQESLEEAYLRVVGGDGHE
jgi:ABC-2 type transport system ATP-binding protein